MDIGFRRYDELIRGSLIVDAVILSIPDCKKTGPTCKYRDQHRLLTMQ